jgi:Protein of unknown function (DUF1592)/Protein of unknown function (DUF1588)/Protein of unknown function (DUF1587)/Protein of unknown function (DUF1585)/Protein of unknown function (DUF1595)
MAYVPRTFLLSCALLAACSGRIDGPDMPLGGGAGGGSRGSAPNGAGSASQELAGRTGPRRLTNLEYDNTVRDLLGTKQRLAASFVAEEAEGFDNVASALGMTPSQFESYFNAADTLAAEFVANSAARSAALGCTPSGDDGGSCLARFLADFGTRAVRRPLHAEEQAGLKRAYTRARGLGESELGALQHVLTAMLASAPFLYRTELPPSAAQASRVRALDGYELASRLSYFLWSTLPDAELFRLAADGSLAEDDTVLREQLARMLDDARAQALVDNFAGQWLGLRELAQHKVMPERYPEFDAPLRDAMIEEARSYFAAFLFEERPFTEFLRAELHFVDARLAAHYGISKPGQAGFTRWEQPIGERRGFLGLAAFLTVSSFAHRTSPTLRAKWVLEELLCSPVPPPPPQVMDQLDGEDMSNAAAGIENVRTRLELHRSDPSCAGCHQQMDPIGLGFESFDGIGKSRDRYENGDPIDTRGELPDGTSFDGPGELSDILTADPRFARCVTEKLLIYALGRSLAGERALVQRILDGAGERASLRALIEQIVTSDAFRQQLDGGGEP